MATNTFVQERCIYAIGEADDGSATWLSQQIKNLTISCDGETVDKTDANGTTIFTIQRAKTCEVTFDTPLMDLNLIAAMNGTTKVEADSDNKINIPKMETIAITSDNLTSVVLAESVVNSGTQAVPAYKISVATLTPDGSMKQKYTLSAAADADTHTYTYTSGTKTLGFASGDLQVGDKILVSYEYQSATGVQIINSANDFPQASRVKFLVKGYDACSQSIAKYLWIILPNAKFTTNYSVTMDLESDISCTLSCAFDYCSEDKELYRMVIAE